MKSFSGYGLLALGISLTGCDVPPAASNLSNTGGASSMVDVSTGGAAPFVDPVAPEDTPVGIHGQLAVNGTRLVDQSGRPVQLKGPSSMWLNWETSAYSENKGALMWMRDNWNAKVIRAAMGITTNGAYLANRSKAKKQVATIVQNAIDLGMYVIIDWHEESDPDQQAEAVTFFTEMAQTYGSYPNVIYEPLNEPHKADWSTVLKPYHEALVQAIRAVDPDNIIVLGTPNWSQWVDKAADDPLVGTNLMYTLHFYSCSHAKWLRDLGDYAIGKGLALFVTEWGATNADGGATGTLCLDEAQTWHDWMNENGLSWAAWRLDAGADLSCILKSGSPVSGGWTDAQLNGHGPFVRDRMREEADMSPDAN